MKSAIRVQTLFQIDVVPRHRTQGTSEKLWGYCSVHLKKFWGWRRTIHIKKISQYQMTSMSQICHLQIIKQGTATAAMQAVRTTGIGDLTHRSLFAERFSFTWLGHTRSSQDSGEENL